MSGRTTKGLIKLAEELGFVTEQGRKHVKIKTVDGRLIGVIPPNSGDGGRRYANCVARLKREARRDA